MAEIIFIASLVFVGYVYVGYAAVIFLLGRIIGRPVRRAEITPRVSVIIAAYNEEAGIGEKLENTLSLDYPADRLEIVVASDSSTDRTDEIVRSFTSRGVVLHRLPARVGKTVAQNSAVRITTGEILVFSDATTIYGKDAIRKIVRSFADPEVGCAAGQLIYVDRKSTAVGSGCRSYWSYEKMLKESESRVCSLIGVSGCLYAVRRSSYARLAHDMSSDFVIATEIHLLGLRTVYEPEAIALEDTNDRGRAEFRMRVRVIEQTMSALSRYSQVLSLRRHGLYAFQMISHKVLRYSVPAMLAVALLANGMLAGSSYFYRLVFIAQIAAYLTALAGWAGEKLGLRLGPLALPYYFVLANAASLAAFFKFLKGEAHVVWEPMREQAREDEKAVESRL